MNNELNKALSENLSILLLELREEVIKGLQNLLLSTNNFSAELI